MHLQIRLFGHFDVQLNSESVTGFRSNKARALLAFLAIEANHPVQRSRLAALLWGDYPDAQARKSLRNAIANLRQLLLPLVETNNLLIDRQTIQLSTSENVFIDVAEFDRLIKASQTEDSPQKASEYLLQSMAYYQGELLASLPTIDGLEFEEWRLFQREVRHRLMMDSLNTVTQNAQQAGNLHDAAQHARRQIQLEPWQERAHQQLMQILLAQGDRSAALAQYGKLKSVLKKELGVKPSVETLALYEQIRTGSAIAEVLPPESSVLKESATKHSPVGTHIAPILDQKLFGVDRATSRLIEIVTAADRPWLVAIDGMGGIGKTTLASMLVHQLVNLGRFTNIAWVSAKQEEFRPATGLALMDDAYPGKPALDIESLTDELLSQLMQTPSLAISADEKRAVLKGLLEESQTLVVIDNLETVPDYQTLVPFLRELANPCKFLITTRFSLRSYSDIFCFSLTELVADDALAFLRHEAELRNMGRLINASQDQLSTIYDVVGGNPLALKLVISQVSFLSLHQVLESLREARGKRIDQLYVYIYWQSWEMLDDRARQLFLAMPAADGGSFMELSLAAALEPDDVQDALSQLMTLSLVQVGGDLEEPRYHLHRLTETFLMNEVLKW